MIYLFVWENYLRNKLLSTWKKSFSEKFSQHNIIYISNILNYEFSFFEQNLLSTWLFSQKNLCIIDDFPFTTGDEDSEEYIKFQTSFLDILPKITSENIIVLNNATVDKRSKIYKEILKIWEIKDFTLSDENDIKNKLHEIYHWQVSQGALMKIIRLKWLHFWNIINELDKLFITKDFIDIADIEVITKDVEESIFEIINDILWNEIKKAIFKLRELSDFLDNPYLLYNSFASNLRFYFYIFQLKLLSYNNTEIKAILDVGNRSFLIDKEYKIDKIKYIKIYQNIASIDSKMKTGKMMGSEKIDMMYEIERSFLK